MKTTLKVTGLDKYFNTENTFSAYDINKFKPEPELFLYACEKMNGTASKTLVIEDTMVGAIAARAAGMDVFIYAPDTEEHPQYKNENYQVFTTYCNFDVK
jgi:beta-phosphoglucomutase-like phosphatase (HAD superfamily)